MASFWKAFGLGLAKVGTGALKVALWASQHPQVIDEAAKIAGHPEVAAVLDKAAPIVGAIASAANNG